MTKKIKFTKKEEEAAKTLGSSRYLNKINKAFKLIFPIKSDFLDIYKKKNKRKIAERTAYGDKAFAHFRNWVEEDTGFSMTEKLEVLEKVVEKPATFDFCNKRLENVADIYYHLSEQEKTIFSNLLYYLSFLDGRDIGKCEAAVSVLFGGEKTIKIKDVDWSFERLVKQYFMNEIKTNSASLQVRDGSGKNSTMNKIISREWPDYDFKETDKLLPLWVRDCDVAKCIRVMEEIYHFPKQTLKTLENIWRDPNKTIVDRHIALIGEHIKRHFELFQRSSLIVFKQDHDKKILKAVIISDPKDTNFLLENISYRLQKKQSGNQNYEDGFANINMRTYVCTMDKIREKMQKSVCQ